MLIERYEDERPDPPPPRATAMRVLAEGWSGPASERDHEAEIQSILGGPKLKVSL
jgi:hydrogenase maturation protease